MLRIYIEERCESVRIRLEGKLAGAWVEELKRCWHNVAHPSMNRSLVIELYEVTFVDTTGQSLLSEMYGAGVTLVGRGILAQYLVERIQRSEAG